MTEHAHAGPISRRQQILDAARACIDDHGLEAVSMGMIVERSGLSTGAVYRYFAGKDEVLACAVLDGTEDFAKSLITVLDQDPPLPLPELLSRILHTTLAQRDEDATSRDLAVHGWSHSRTDLRLAAQLRAIYTDIRLKFARSATGSPTGPASDTARSRIDRAQLLTWIVLGSIVQRCLIADTAPDAVGDTLAGLVRHAGAINNEGTFT